jgi:hypothetical protein
MPSSYQFTQGHIPEDNKVHSHCPQNHKSHEKIGMQVKHYTIQNTGLCTVLLSALCFSSAGIHRPRQLQLAVH